MHILWKIGERGRDRDRERQGERNREKQRQKERVRVKDKDRDFSVKKVEWLEWTESCWWLESMARCSQFTGPLFRNGIQAHIRCKKNE